MKLTFSFQTLIMSVLATVLTLATAFWALAVYDSIYRIILGGFDQKLQALAGGAAVLTDGDAHADYQRPHRISAICGGSRIWGFDEERDRFVEIDPAAGGALPLEPQPSPSPRPIAELACAVDDGRVLALDVDGALHWLLGEPLALREDLPPLSEIFHAQGSWWGRSGNRLHALLAEAPAETGDGSASEGPAVGSMESPGLVALGAAVDRLAFDADMRRLVGIGIEAGEVVELAPDGRMRRRFSIDLDGRRVQGLVVQGDQAYLASSGLLAVDLDSGELGAEPPPPGYFSESHPFIERYAPAYRHVRKVSGLTFLYTEQILAGDQLRYILDGSEGDDHTPPGYEDTIPEDSLQDLQAAQNQGRAYVSDIRQWEVWGLIKLAAEPIFASDGRVVALAGADVDIGVIRGKTRNALFAVLGVGVGLLLLAAWVSLRVSRSLTRPLREIKDAALRIAAGYFDRPPEARGRDEIAGLAGSLAALGTRLQGQERQSQAYQQTLVSGRMQMALEHALRDESALAASGLPFEPPADAASGLRASAVGDPRACLYWDARFSGEGLEPARDQARVLQLARSLLRRKPLATAQDLLFSAEPQLTCLLAWQAEEQTLRVRCRGSLRVERVDRDGSSATLKLADGMVLPLRGCTGLALPGGWTLALAPPVEEALP
ncbi:HAMP domain-containing protein [Pseudomarimonas salicorniae]|uniref:HAMP domain-containing protein n=1 Tax=Pseudomarimonas salicorniae TaxID=2933270 RepID=A0ABT0GNP1_9GAMM|nr:HAMP domain-containing protein [Lysobacter sp. CAU 1642]MCK7595605.1 HAMP domain-containing protein [Lysobacter sp. CAU 1642]